MKPGDEVVATDNIIDGGADYVIRKGDKGIVTGESGLGTFWYVKFADGHTWSIAKSTGETIIKEIL